MENFAELASIITTVVSALGAILGWVIRIKWSKASMDAKEDIIKQKQEKIQHLEENREELLRLKDEQIKLLELQLKAKEKKPKTGKRKS